MILAKSERRIPVSDDWYPSHDRHGAPYVEGRCTLIDWSKGPSRKHRKRNIVEFHAQISVWGADDTGYAMWSSHDNEADARRAYEGYCRWLGRVAVLTQEIAKSVGFRVR